MVRTAVAFCPGHISGYFKKVAGETPETTGSLGAGIVVDEGVRVTASAADRPCVVIRQVDGRGRTLSESTGAPPVEYLMTELGVAARVETTCHLPIGSGFGLSAAALLASATALDALFDLGLGREGVAALAHRAEVVHNTGLGDVAACQGGGVVCREGPGTAGARITRVMTDETVHALSFGPLPTPEVIGSPEQLARVAAAFPPECPRDFAEFFSFSRAFAEKSGLVRPEVRAALDACDEAGVPASMTMLGLGVFAAGEGAGEVLAGFGDVYPLSVAEEGFRLVEVRES
ncbi:GHMP kinase [Methanofollis formosanus]|uniref:Pantoate kinase n=1 Tax=Methanofollis formosanus TaxID=299308 RepID=A0A8G1EG14_9EURY|nr:pantoate kinase [Methanofollis formosanus]QYZ78676.1 GHMP kinase [Methanofollis formosanus]